MFLTVLLFFVPFPSKKLFICLAVSHSISFCISLKTAEFISVLVKLLTFGRNIREQSLIVIPNKVDVCACWPEASKCRLIKPQCNLLIQCVLDGAAGCVLK